LPDYGNAVKANAEATIQTPQGELTIARFKVIQQGEKPAWVAFPDIRYKDKDTGDYKSLPIVIPSRRLKKIIADAIIEKFAEVHALAQQQ